MKLTYYWTHITIAKRLYAIIGLMTFLIIMELLTLKFAMTNLSAVRAFVGSEGMWSKAQKNAALTIQDYVSTRDEKDYHAFLEFLKIPEGTHVARVEIFEKQNPDLDVARKGFLAGHLHPNDIDPMIKLLTRFHGVSYIKKATSIWEKGDKLISQFRNAGIEYHALLASHSKDKKKIQKIVNLLRNLNEKLTTLEVEFSEVLGEGSRWLESLLLSSLLLLILTIEAIGITLTLLTCRSLSKGLFEISSVAKAIGEGEFNRRANVASRDEIKIVADSINHMGWMLNNIYQELELRVHNRTIQLEEALRISDNFLSIASHELRTPLTSLKLQVQLRKKMLQSGNMMAFNEDSLKKMLHHDEKQINCLVQLITDMLDITNINAGKLNLRIEQINLGNLIKSILDQLASSLEEAGCSLTLDIDDAIIGHWDGFRLEQAFMNLMTNAIKYGAGHFIHIILEAHEGKVRLIVRDHGIGIAIEDQSRIFLPFERAVSEDQISELGLGLHIIKGIVEAHGGTISLNSEICKGSTFMIELNLGSVDNSQMFSEISPAVILG